MWGGVEYEIQNQGCDDFFIWGEVLEWDSRNTLQLQQRQQWITSDVQATCTLYINPASIVAREEDMFHWSGPRIFCRAPTLHRDAGYEHPAIYRDILWSDSQNKSRDKMSNSITW